MLRAALISALLVAALLADGQGLPQLAQGSVAAAGYFGAGWIIGLLLAKLHNRHDRRRKERLE